MTTETTFIDTEPPSWPASIVVDAPDGDVRLWRARDPSRRAWFAATHEHDTDETTHVAWSRPPGEPARYACARCGSGHRRDTCTHVLAATRAAEIFEREG